LENWFLNNGIYIIIALVIGGALLFLIARYGDKVVTRIIPHHWQKEFSQAFILLSRLIRIIVIIIVVLILSVYIIHEFGINIQPVLNAIIDWLGEHGIPILVIIVLACLINKLAQIIIPIIIQRFMKIRGKGKKAIEEVNKRASTLSGFSMNAVSVLLILLSLFMILSEIGIDIGPLLAGAGVLGLALGIGAQKLIGDLINGIFIVLEDYYGKGDVVRLANIAGVVEDVNIRRTVLRDLDGIVHIIPNSEVQIASNFTKHWARVNLNISVGYGEDLDKAIEVINKVGNELAGDKYFKPMLISPPQVLRVDNLGDSGIEIKIIGDTKPMKQWEITGELRKRLKKAFDEAGIEIPWPHTKVYFGNALPGPEKSQLKKHPVSEAKTAEPKQRKIKKREQMPDDDSE
jgi:small-conductance mechanosensitive channel